MSTPTWRQDPWRHPLRTIVLGVIRFYQLWISPLTPPSCRFYPSCSAYGMQSVERFGPLRGTRMAIWRIMRCNPWNPGGIDHVPAKGPDGRPAPSPSDHEPRIPAHLRDLDPSGPEVAGRHEHDEPTSHTA